VNPGWAALLIRFQPCRVARSARCTGALWPHSQPSAAMLAAYAADPALAAMRLDFTDTIREVLAVMAAGLLARRP